jgi:hypothetical protein
MKSNSTLILFKEQALFWINAEFFSVGLSAFAGTAIRVGISNSLSGRSIPAVYTSSYGAMLQVFYSQTFLISNFLGCIIMAYCITYQATISGVSVPLYKALTTGIIALTITITTITAIIKKIT